MSCRIMCWVFNLYSHEDFSWSPCILATKRRKRVGLMSIYQKYDKLVYFSMNVYFDWAITFKNYSMPKK